MSPGRVFFLAMLVPTIAVSFATWLWLRKGYVGEMEMSVLRGPFRPVNSGWLLPVIGALTLLGYALLAGVAFLFTRHKTLQYRNAVTLVLVPLYLVAVWILVATKS